MSKKREEGHRSGWMNCIAILLVILERGDSEEIIKLIEQYLALYILISLHGQSLLMILSFLRQKHQLTLDSGTEPTRAWQG